MKPSSSIDNMAETDNMILQKEQAKRLLTAIYEDDAIFVKELLKGASEEDIEKYFEEFPEYRELYYK